MPKHAQHSARAQANQLCRAPFADRPNAGRKARSTLPVSPRIHPRRSRWRLLDCLPYADGKQARHCIGLNAPRSLPWPASHTPRPLRTGDRVHSTEIAAGPQRIPSDGQRGSTPRAGENQSCSRMPPAQNTATSDGLTKAGRFSRAHIHSWRLLAIGPTLYARKRLSLLFQRKAPSPRRASAKRSDASRFRLLSTLTSSRALAQAGSRTG